MKKVNLLILSGLLWIPILILWGCGEKGDQRVAKHDEGTERHEGAGHHKEAEHHGGTERHEGAGHVHEQETVIPEHPGQFSGEEAEGIREVKVEAFQFGFKPETITVKKGEKVRLFAKSTDVTHGIGIKAFNINQALPPGEEKIIEFTAERAGEFHFHCSVYCGAGHGKMHGTLVVKE